MDKDYRIDEIDTEVQVAPNGISLPLVTIDRQEVQDLIDTDLDGHLQIVDGYYKLSYGDTPDPVVVNGIDIPHVDETIKGAFGTIDPIALDIPDFDFKGGTQIQALGLNPTGSFPVGMPSGVPPAVAYPGSVSSNDGAIEIDVTDLPDQLQEITTVYIGDANDTSNPNGALVSMTIDLGELTAATASLIIDELTVELPARYTLALAGNYGGKASVSALGGSHNNVFTLTDYTVPDVSDIEVQFYITQIDFSDLTITNGSIYDDEPFSFAVSYDLTTDGVTPVDTSGTPPSASITGAPAFRDADFVVSEIVLDEQMDAVTLGTVDNIPSDVAEMVGVQFDNGQLTIKLNDFTLPFDESSAPTLSVHFPATFDITAPAPGQFNASTNTLSIPLDVLQAPAGYTFTVDGLSWENGTGVPVGGSIDLGDVSAEFLGELKTEMTWSTDVENADIPDELDITIDVNPAIELESVTARLDMQFGPEFTGDIAPIDLTGITDELKDSEVVADLLPPALILSVTNPVGIMIEGMLKLIPDGDEAGATTIDNVVIQPAGQEGEVTTDLFIVDESDDRATPAGYTRVTADMKDLFLEIPDQLEIEFEIGTDINTVQTIPLEDQFVFAVSYSIDMPVGFGDRMSLNLDIEEDGLKEDVFADLAGKKVKAAEISVSVELEVSFPLKIADVEAQLLDVDGQTIPGLNTYITGVIEGPAPAAEGTPRKSTLTIGLEVPDGGDFTALSSIDILKLTLPITPTGTEPGDKNYIRPTDYISGRAWINLPQGIGANLDEL